MVIVGVAVAVAVGVAVDVGSGVAVDVAAAVAVGDAAGVEVGADKLRPVHAASETASTKANPMENFFIRPGL
jgi:hypothetical protein